MTIYYNNPRDLGNPMAQAGIAPPLYQRSPYATATVMAHPVMQAGDRGYYPPTGGAYPQYPYGAPYGPSVGFGVGTAPTWSVTPLTGYPSAYPHVLNGAVMAGEPFRMTQYFGPAYMPGFMDMMLMRMLGGMMGGGRGGGGGGGGGGSTKKTAPAQTPAPAMDIKWAPCTTKGCQGRSLLFNSGVDTGLPLVDTPADLAADGQAPAAPVPGSAQDGWPVLNAAPPLPGEGSGVAPIIPAPTAPVAPSGRVPANEGLLDFMQRQWQRAWNPPARPAPVAPTPVVPAPAAPAPVVRPFSDTLS